MQIEPHSGSRSNQEYTKGQHALLLQKQLKSYKLCSRHCSSLMSLLLPPQWRRGWQALCEDLTARRCNEQGVLKLRRALAVCCDSGPAVWPCHISVGAHVDHGFDSEDLPLFHDSDSLQHAMCRHCSSVRGVFRAEGKLEGQPSRLSRVGKRLSEGMRSIARGCTLLCA